MPEKAKTENAHDGVGKLLQSLSQFLARVLDQLSLSSWLPTILFVLNAVWLIAIGVGVPAGEASTRSHDPVDAALFILDQPVSILIGLPVLVVAVAVLTQGVGFELIRFMEGYWQSFWPISWLATLGIRLQGWRLRHAQKRESAMRERAHASVVECLKSVGVDRPSDALVTNVLQGDAGIWRRRYFALRGVTLPPAGSVPVEPAVQHQIENLAAAARRYPPDPSRLLPTRLGNTLRGAEDRLDLLAGERLESFVLRRFDGLPQSLREQHDEFRGRLEMYCHVSALMGLLSLGALAIALVDLSLGVSLALVYCGLALLCARQARFAAEGYGEVLLTMNPR